ncbi:hypothetical protein [Streptomyces collinus]|uniref:hypothetical protein n=1 Tax=Streptomyces collinus TaxID=42684 RepID=UPI0037B5F015
MNWFRKFRKSKTPTPALVVQHNELSDALAELASTFGDGYVAFDTGSKFTCSEADSVARVLAVAGHEDAAVTWLRGHAEGDEGGDSHHVYEDDEDQDGHQMDEDEVRAYITGVLA